jgi:hypothetical protein
MKAEVVVRCWNCGYQGRDVMTAKGQEIFEKRVKKGQLGCPQCSSPVFIEAGHGIFINSRKLFRCDDGHITVIGCMQGDTPLLNISSHGQFDNVEGHIDDLQNMLDERHITCRCSGPLTAVDDNELSYNQGIAFRTKTRVGDIWDQNRAQPVRSGTYDGAGEFRESATDQANKERLKKMSRKRNIPKERLPQTVAINEPTKKVYKKK